MGYLKARMSSFAVKELELVYLGCLVVVLLAFPLRPVEYTDMFRYADPAASLLDPMMSRMVFANGNDSNSTENSSLLNKVVIGNQKLWPESRKITSNGTTKLFLTYKRRILGPSRDPTLLVNNLPRALDNTFSNHSPAIFSYIFSVVSSTCKFRMSCYASMEKGEKDICYEYNDHYNDYHWSWYQGLVSVREEVTWKTFSNTSNVNINGEDELDKKVMDLFLSMNLNITSFQYRETKIRGSNLSNIIVIPEYGLIGTDTSFSHDFNNFIKHITQNKKNNKSHIPMMLGVIEGIIIGSFISILSWKFIKNLGSNYESDTFYPFPPPLLDDSYLTDHSLYEMLLDGAILVSSGSSGKVYKLKFFERECAMKVFFSHARMDFRREAVIVLNLDHPHIIKFFCCFRKSFIIMELLDEDLYSFIKKIREKTSDYELSLEVALDIMLQIAEGMSYLHDGGIAHQDLKSLNIFLKLQGEPHSSNFRIIAKIADFGSARTFDPRHPRGFCLRPMENIGTRSWRAPELFPPRGGFLTKVFGMACGILPKPLDIYGFAIICSELLTKQIPYSNTSEPRIVHGVELRAGLRPTLPSHGCPEELIALIEDCWHTNPQSRPEFREICTRLSRLIEVQSHDQTPSTL